MGRFFSFASILIVLAVGTFIYMRQVQSTSLGGASTPQGTVDIVGVKYDLMAIAQAERMHNGLRGGYASLDELRSSGDLTMPRNNRGPYSYAVEVTGSGFRATATFAADEGAKAPRTISVDQTMEITSD